MRSDQIGTDRYRRLFDQALELLCVAGTDGYFKEVNPAFTRVLGYSAKELLARPFVEFVHPDDRERTDVEVVHLNDGQASVNFENRYRHKDGHYVNLSWKGSVPTEDMTTASNPPLPSSSLKYLVVM